MTAPLAAPPAGARLIVLSALLVLAAAVPVGGALLIAGPVAAMGVYLGVVVATTVVPSLPRAQQWIAAGWLVVVASSGALIGPRPGPLVAAVALCALAQVFFLRMDVKALAVSPAILVFYAYSVPASATVTVAVATLIGAAYLIGAGALARMPSAPHPLSWPRALTHATLLAVGCTALVLLGPNLGGAHAHWGPLAFCLAFTPGAGSVRTALRYALATGIGAAAAVVVCLLAPSWLVLVAVAAGAVLVVAGTLAKRSMLSVAGIAGTVILIGSLAPGVPTRAFGLGVERIGTALLAVAIGLALLLVADPLQRLISRPLESAARRRTDAEPKGDDPWIR